jgi:putative tryptophan/tyrosine transport system substrate-binding protein
MRRRDFITLVGGVAAGWPLAARAQQQPNRVRRIGVLMNYASDDPEGQARLGLFLKRLQVLGWADGRTARIDVRWAADDPALFRQYASELVAVEPNVILASSSFSVAALQHVSRSVPIVFTSVADPVGAGFVESLGRPGENTTGFALFEYSIAAKWLELLKEIAPDVTRVAVLRDPTVAAGIGQFSAIQAVGLRGIDLSVVDIRDTGIIERAVATFARGSNGGLIVTASLFGANHPGFIATLATRYKLPAIFPSRYFTIAGGLLSYGPDGASPHGLAADYVNRILNGEKPADLPVQVPSKYELVINLKTAKTLGITVPASLLARADEVIE